ncbi:hypothetical protein HDU76_002338 [Blyttiomyces sp. JEL0837]|nr:hypothetical protein HDU76_002338 [Blyttiomyces sp. JEL0837]
METSNYQEIHESLTKVSKETQLVIVIPGDLDDDKFVQRKDSGVEVKENIIQEQCDDNLERPVSSGSTREEVLGDSATSITDSETSVNAASPQASALIVHQEEISPCEVESDSVEHLEPQHPVLVDDGTGVAQCHEPLLVDCLLNNVMPPWNKDFIDLGAYGCFTREGLLFLEMLHDAKKTCDLAINAWFTLSETHGDIVDTLMRLKARGKDNFEAFSAQMLLSLLPGEWVEGDIIGYIVQNNIFSDVNTHVVNPNILPLLFTTPEFVPAPPDSCNNIFVPLNVHQNHWVVLLLDLVNRIVLIGDSLAGDGIIPNRVYEDASDPWSEFGSFWNWINSLYNPDGRNPFTVAPMQHYPQQHDSVSCGVITMAVAEMVSRGISWSTWKWSPAAVDRYRIHLMKTVLVQNGFLEGEVVPYEF